MADVAAAPYPQSSPTDRSKVGGLFHSVKKALFGGDKQAVHDPEFEEARNQFFKLAEQSMKAQQQLIEYNNHMTGLLQSAGYVANELSELLEDPVSHPYLALGRELRRTHVQLSSENGAVSLARQLADGSVKRLNDAVDLHKDLASRLQKRMELKSEYEYYTKKVMNLQQDKAQTASSGKEQKPQDIERLRRNEQKLTNIRMEFDLFSSKLLQDIRLAWANRWMIFGPATAEFVKVERDFVMTYAAAMRDIPQVDENSSSFQSAIPPALVMNDYNKEHREFEDRSSVVSGASVTDTTGMSASTTPIARSRAGSIDDNSIAANQMKAESNPFGNQYQSTPPPPSYGNNSYPPPPPPAPPAPPANLTPVQQISIPPPASNGVIQAVPGANGTYTVVVDGREVVVPASVINGSNSIPVQNAASFSHPAYSNRGEGEMTTTSHPMRPLQ